MTGFVGEKKEKHTAIHVSGCRVCLSFVSMSNGRNQHPCGNCAQVEELFSLGSEFWEKVNRLRSIRESEKINWYH